MMIWGEKAMMIGKGMDELSLGFHSLALIPLPFTD